MKKIEQQQQQQPDDNPRTAAKISSLLVMIVAIIIFVWYVMSDRRTPSTSQATVKGLVLAVSPMISGYVTGVNVGLHSQVERGDVLFEIDKTPYQIAVSVAEANLDKVTQSVNAANSSIKAASATLGVANAKFDRATRNWNRTQRVMRDNIGALSGADADKSETTFIEAKEQVATAQANLDQAIETLGPTGADNPNVIAALKQLQKAQLDLAYTTIIAPIDGAIESFNIENGYFASIGQPLVSLVSNENLWIQADLKENNLSNIRLNNKVDIIFDISPGYTGKGIVRSIAYGVSTGQAQPGTLPQVSSSQSWLRDPQRFPVIIEILDPEIKARIRQGSQVEIVIYTGDHPILNCLASWRITILSYLSYVR